MAQISAVVQLVNKTNHDLSLDPNDCSLGAGEWVTSPPESIPAQSTGEWESESEDEQGGTHGRCNYIIQDGSDAQVELFWAVPSLGENRATSDVNDSGIYVCTPPNPGSYNGDNPTMVFTLRESN
jgi:hypothetical protein